MRAPALLVALFLVAVLVASPARAAPDFGAVGYVNKLINILSTPQLEPGQSGDFAFQFNSTYPAGMTLYDVHLNVSMYEYQTIDSTVPVDASWTYPYPYVESTHGREWWWNATSVAPGSVTNLSFTVVTSADSNLMPSGSVFNQASYVLRMWLDFDGNVSGSLTHFTMASRGYFSAAAWAAATNTTYTVPCNPPSCRGNLNLTKLGVQGILPDSSFGVKQPIPRWPFYALIGLAIFFVILAFLYWVEENPGTYPRVETWWARQRGRLARLRPRRHRRPAAREAGAEPPKANH
ncbi:MAG TPA: hypothetical protein VEY12_10165 [Thermoplasmata archaeon]|nr:hypothetical protein [Thermoplasmata archaeon]